MKKRCELFNYSDLIFQISYLIHLFVSFNTYLNCTFAPNITLVVLLVATILCFINRLQNFKETYNNLFFYLCIAFIISYFVSSFIITNYSFSSSIKSLIWIGFQFFFLYIMKPIKDFDKFEFNIKFIGLASIVYFSVINIIAFILMKNNVNVFQTAPDGSIQFYGFWFGRLFGFFDDANHGAVIAVIAILFAVGLFNTFKNKFVKFVLVLSIMIQFVFIVFTDSRTGIVSLVTGAVLYILSNSLINFDFKKFIKSMILSLGISIAIVFGSGLVKDVYNYSLQNNVVNNDSVQGDDDITDSDSLLENEEIDDEKQESNTIGREEEISNDISNRRFSIWKSGIEIFNTSKLFGVGYNNIVEYAKNNLPDTYLIANDYQVFNSFHNSFIDILVSQGIIGSIIFISLFLYNVILLFKNLVALEINSQLCAMLISIVGVGLVSSLFISNILYINSIESFYFWLSLGYINNLIMQKFSKGGVKNEQ